MRFVGIDVSAKKLSVIYKENSSYGEYQEFDNTHDGFKKLISYIRKDAKKQSIRVCLEATGIYHFDLAVALSKNKDIEIMVINPKASKNFYEVCMSHNKTDELDANLLANFCERMDFVAWEKPRDEYLTLRCLSRRLSAFADSKAQAKNQLHALSSTEHTLSEVIESQKRIISSFETETKILEEFAMEFIDKHLEIKNKYELLILIDGIAKKSAIQILGELLILPKDLTAKQWVAHSGLNPVEHKSGSSVNKKSRISKAGNKYLRRALYMPAISASTNNRYVRGYYQHLINDKGLKKRQAHCAIMRKTLHMIHKIFETESAYDEKKFYHTPVEKIVKERIVRKKISKQTDEIAKEKIAKKKPSKKTDKIVKEKIINEKTNNETSKIINKKIVGNKTVKEKIPKKKAA